MYTFKIGDKVRVRESGKVDLCQKVELSTEYLGVGTVRSAGPVSIPEEPLEQLFAVEFEFDLVGGHDCMHTCQSHRGQYITAKHLELAQYDVTVPNIGVACHS